MENQTLSIAFVANKKLTKSIYCDNESKYVY